jgi:hypothetical protein
MPGKVELEIVEGPMKGQKFAFEEHDTFLFGRMPDCHACLPNDAMVSRNHFIIEVNPPDARIRDLGSLNGTHVNGVKYGGREMDETPEEGARRKYPEVDLKDGDRITIGSTVCSVRVLLPALCCQCDREITDEERENCKWIGGTFICPACKSAPQAKVTPVEPVLCQKCGNDVSEEAGRARRGDYICKSCQKQAQIDPGKIILEILRKAGKLPDAGKLPEIKGYRIEKMLAAGGFGAVYLARSEKDGRPVAVKVMLARVAVDEPSRKRFLREINEMKKLHHENIVTLVDSGSAGGAFYAIMDFCEGGSVDQLMMRRRGKLSLSEARPIMVQSMEGLDFVHKNQVVHRDLKPGNILLAGREGDWTAKIGDLGFAKNFQKAGLSGPTITGEAAGTPQFMPREQVTNFKYVKPVSDVWSMAATFYCMLTGQFPRNFPRGKDRMEIVLRGGTVPIRDRDPGIPKGLAKVIDRALDDSIKKRYQTAGEFKKALEKAI